MTDTEKQKTFEELFTVYLTTRVNSYRSCRQYENLVQRIVDESGKDFLSLTINDVAGFLQKLRSKRACYSARTVDGYLATLQAIARFMEDEVPGYHSPFRMFSKKAPATFYTEKEIPERQQVSELLNKAEEEGCWQAFLAITLAYRLALTSAEMVSLTSDNFARRGDDIVLTLHPETCTERTVPVPEDVFALIRRFRPHFFSTGGNLFTSTKKPATSLSDRTLRRYIKNLQKDKKPEDQINLLNIRTLGVLELCQANTDVEQVAEFAGIDSRWMFRYEMLAKDRPVCNCDLPNIRITTQK